MKSKKLTYKELASYIVSTEDKLNNALNTLGQTLIDFIEFNMYERASYIGITSAFQADEVGSIPTARSRGGMCPT